MIWGGETGFYCILVIRWSLGLAVVDENENIFLGVKLNLFSDLLKLKNKKLVGRDVLSFQVYLDFWLITSSENRVGLKDAKRRKMRKMTQKTENLD